jgi:hypothetical protein
MTVVRLSFVPTPPRGESGINREQLFLLSSVISVYSVANCFAFDIEKCQSNIPT